MKGDLYQKVQYATGMQSDKKLFSSIRLYLLDYKDTSKSKVDRLKALQAADNIVDYVIRDVLKFAGEDIGSKLFSAGIYSVSNSIKFALVSPNTLYDFKDAIGFLNIIEK